MPTQETLDYLLKRQRKSILQECRTIAVVGASPDPQSTSYVQIEKLLGFGLAIHPILPGCRRFLGIKCYNDLTSVPGSIDIVLVFPNAQLDLHKIALQACKKKVSAFWVEDGDLGAETRLALAQAMIHVVEHESLTADYARHFPFVAGSAGPSRTRRRRTVADCMSRHPVTIQRTDTIETALARMKAGHFRHLPVVNEEGRLVGIVSDRDLKLIPPHIAFGSGAEPDRHIRSLPVEQAAFFDPVTIRPEDSLENAAGAMLRWNVGAVPVVRSANALTGIITYADILREFIARGERGADR